MRINYAGKYVVKIDPDVFWINGSFGVQEVPYLWEQWAKIRYPVLELKGEESEFLSPAIQSEMKEKQPNLQILEVPESGHGITGDNPDFLLKESRSFFVE